MNSLIFGLIIIKINVLIDMMDLKYTNLLDILIKIVGNPIFSRIVIYNLH